MFAEAATSLPDPNNFASIGWLLVGLAAIAFGANQVVSLWGKIAKPSGADAMHAAAARFQPAGNYVTREEFQTKFNELTHELHGIRTDMREMERNLGDGSEERIKDVHNRLDLMPDRIIAQLTNLGVLRRPSEG